jgi:hypothetical protein
MIDEEKRPLGFSLNTRLKRRLYVVIVVCLCAVFCGIFLRYQLRRGVEDFDSLILISFFLGVAGALGGVRRIGPVKLFVGFHVPFRDRAPHNDAEETPWLDEREQSRRDRVHFRAYAIVRWLGLLTLATYAALGEMHVSWFSHIGPFAVVLLVLVLWVLPQMMILWSELDVEAEEKTGGTR